MPRRPYRPYKARTSPVRGRVSTRKAKGVPMASTEEEGVATVVQAVQGEDESGPRSILNEEGEKDPEGHH